MPSHVYTHPKLPLALSLPHPVPLGLILDVHAYLFFRPFFGLQNKVFRFINLRTIVIEIGIINAGIVLRGDCKSRVISIRHAKISRFSPRASATTGEPQWRMARPAVSGVT
jgi:hypothetical protein